MATVPHPLQEKLTLFWHGHFCDAARTRSAAPRTCTTRTTCSAPQALGGFENLVQQMSLQVAMLIYLDNDPN